MAGDYDAGLRMVEGMLSRSNHVGLLERLKPAQRRFFLPPFLARRLAGLRFAAFLRAGLFFFAAFFAFFFGLAAFFLGFGAGDGRSTGAAGAGAGVDHSGVGCCSGGLVVGVNGMGSHIPGPPPELLRSKLVDMSVSSSR